MRVKDNRQFGYFIVDNRVLDHHLADLKPSGFVVYCAIVRAADRRTRETRPFYSTLARRLGVGRATIARTVRRCVQLGLLEVVKRPGKGSVYTLPDYGAVSSSPAEDLRAGEEAVTRVTREPERFHGETGTGSMVGRLPFPPETGGGIAPLTGLSTITINNCMSAVAGDELGVKNAQGAALLASQGVSQEVAEDLANRLDVSLVGLIIDYWRAGANGVKEVGVGLLVHICQRPAAHGFREVDGRWVSPPFKIRRGGRKEVPTAAAAETIKDKAARVSKERQEAAAERSKAKAYPTLNQNGNPAKVLTQ